MITDENLNDCSNTIVHMLEVKYKQRKKIQVQYMLLTLLLFILLILTCLFGLHDKKIIKELSTKVEQEEQMLSLEYSIGYWFINQPEEVNDSILYVFLKNNNAWYPEILLKQAKIESGNYTSNVYMNTNNLYGMRKVGKRQTTQLNTTYKGYGCYTNWCESVLDRMLWDIFYFKNEKPNKEEYLKAMSIYAEDEDYSTKIQ